MARYASLPQDPVEIRTTPTVKYGYDAIAPSGCTAPALTINNGIGRRTSMCDAAAAEAWSYDAMGRAQTDRRTTNSIPPGTRSTGTTWTAPSPLLAIQAAAW